MLNGTGEVDCDIPFQVMLHKFDPLQGGIDLCVASKTRSCLDHALVYLEAAQHFRLQIALEQGACQRTE